MSDSQWPRWEVFKKDKANKPYQAVGSVHAVDSEHALLNARDIFVRRPAAVGLWVVPAAAVYAMNAEQLEKQPGWDQEGLAPNSEPVVYAIFRKSSHRRSMTFVEFIGEVTAVSPQSALKEAIGTFTDKPALTWWVVPKAAIVSSQPEMVASWFEPAKDKTYKQQSAYGFISSTRGNKQNG